LTEFEEKCMTKLIHGYAVDMNQPWIFI